MAYQKNQNIREILPHFKKKKFEPVYFLFGNDNFALNKVVDLFENTFEGIIKSEFDKKIIFGSDNQESEILDFALSFPFSSDLKLIIVKEFQKLKDHKQIDKYINNPADTTVLVMVHEGEIRKLDTKFYKALIEKKWLFEAVVLKEEELSNWAKKYLSDNGKTISNEDLGYFLDIIGDNRDLMQMQLEKIITFLGDAKEVTYEIIREQVYHARRYTVFDLFNAISANDRKKSFKIALNILEEEEIIPVIGSLNKFFTGVAQVPELEKSNLERVVKGRMVGGNYYTYPSYVQASRIFGKDKLLKIARGLLDADIAVKSSQDEKLVITTLLTVIFSK